MQVEGCVSMKRFNDMVVYRFDGENSTCVFTKGINSITSIDLDKLNWHKDTQDDDEEANKFKHQHLTELNIAKHRNGSIGTIQFTFDSAIGKFKEFHNE